MAIYFPDWIVARILLDRELKCRVLPLGLGGSGEELGIAVRGFWHEVTRNSSKLHEVLEAVKRFQACTYMIEFGYIHAVLWLNRAGGR